MKKHCRKSFSERAEIYYPDDAESRYKSTEEPISKISFVLSNKEIRKLLWYDYFIGERMLVFIVPIIVALLISVIIQNNWLVILAGFLTIITFILTVMFFREADGYIKNHQGQLYALLYDDLFVIQLHGTDLELEYASMKRMKDFGGLWRMKSGNFFVLALPKRIIAENNSFFNELYKKIK